jgi:sulfoxide reductase heme-binding subunit YedZ
MTSTSKSEPTAFVVPLAILAGAVLLAAIGGGAASGHAAWYAARASGLIAYVLATASVLFGLASATRAGNKKPGLGFVTDVHRALSLLTLLAIGGHVVFLALDSYARFGVLDLLVPFVSWYRPVWTGLGVVAGYLAVAVFASFYVRSLIGYRAWRTFHYAAFGVFGLGSIHGLLAGTDSSAVWGSMIYALAIAAVALMASYRLLRGSGHRPAWAFDESTGNLGAARAVLATVALFAALVLPLWTISRAANGTVPSSQPSAVAGVSLSAGGNGATAGSSQDVSQRTLSGERERDDEREGNEGERD